MRKGFFTTPFVKVEPDSVKLAHSVWIYFICAVICTLLTIMVWTAFPTIADLAKKLMKITKTDSEFSMV